MTQTGRWLITAGVALLSLSPAARASEDDDAVASGEASGPDPRWDLLATVSGRRYSIQYTTGSHLDGLGEQTGFSAIGYWAPLRSDGSPYSLRPFLQRASHWYLTLEAGHFATVDPIQNVDRTDWNAVAETGADIYARSWLAVAVGATYGYDILSDFDVARRTHAIGGYAGFGLRFGDTRVDVSYALTGYVVRGAGRYDPTSRRCLQLGVFSAFARRVTAGLSGTLIPGGWDGKLQLEYFVRRSLGIFAGALTAHGQLYTDTALIERRYTGSGGIAAWLDAKTALLARYTLVITDTPLELLGPAGYYYGGSRETSHSLLLEAILRLP